ncbi:MBL fold metallo-hydrolase [Hyphomicrobium methylovorum]|nr:MBL fold metallo-hydrolase [Hyphomicrobium methylovorum]
MALVASSASAATGSQPNGEADGARSNTAAKLTVLFDAIGNRADLRKDWGYAALVEVGGRRILFDTGNDAAVLAHNTKALGVDLGKLDFVVISHRHGDHTTGLSHVLSVNPGVKIYAPEEKFGVFGSSLPATFLRPEPRLPKDSQYFGGTPPERMTFGKAWPEANITLIDKTTEIAPGVHLISLVSDKPGTLELRELSLAIETPDGIVLVVGCSHPGIDRIVEVAKTINPKIHLIAGGLHLVTSSDAEIASQVAALNDKFHVAWIAAGHCTGEPAFMALMDRFGDRNIYAGVGATIGLGSNPRAEGLSTVRHAMATGELQTYRQAMRDNLIRFGRRPSADVHNGSGQ